MTTETDNTRGSDERKRGRLRRISGILLAVIGLFWLAHKAGWVQTEHGHPALFWPIVVIAIGVFMFFGFRHHHRA